MVLIITSIDETNSLPKVGERWEAAGVKEVRIIRLIFEWKGCIWIAYDFLTCYRGWVRTAITVDRWKDDVVYICLKRVENV